MKAFLQEYGFAILATIVVILLIMMVSPVGIKIRDSIEGVVLKFGDSAENGLDSANLKLNDSLNTLVNGENGGSDSGSTTEPETTDPVEDGFTVSVSPMSDHTRLRLQFDGKEGETIELSKVSSFKVNGTELLGNPDYELLRKNAAWRGVGVEHSEEWMNANLVTGHESEFNLSVYHEGENTWAVTYDGVEYTGVYTPELVTVYTPSQEPSLPEAAWYPEYAETKAGVGTVLWEETTGLPNDADDHTVYVDGVEATLRQVQHCDSGSSVCDASANTETFLIVGKTYSNGEHTVVFEYNGYRYTGTFTVSGQDRLPDDDL